MKITLLSHNLSSNSFQRIYPIYLVLQRHFDVEIVGPYFGKGLFSPYEGMIPYKGIRGSSYPGFLFKIKRLLSLIEGDIVYVFKPMATSFGIALLKTLGSRQPIVLDIEDWDLGEWIQTWQEEEPLTILRWILHDLRFPQSAVLAWPFEKLVPLADAITVGTRFLEQRFGGHYLPPCVDVHDFDPKRYNRKAARQKWRINEREKIILFSGTPCPHKGLDELIEAAGAAGRIVASAIRIVLVGGDPSEPYCRSLIERGSSLIHFTGYQPHDVMPELLALADLIVLAQRDTIIARAQMPGKLYEAMAMAKPIVATRLSDLPETLRDCGVIVEPGDQDGLTAAIVKLVQDESSARKLGQKARDRCIREYSLEAMEQRLLELLGSIHGRVR